MSSRRLLTTLILVLIILVLARPTAMAQEVRRLWDRREYTIKVLATVITIYFLYGLYKLWTGQGW